MNTILLILCNALSCFIISTILFQFMNGKYKRSSQNRYVYIVVETVTVIFTTCINMFNHSILNLVLWGVLTGVIAYALYYEDMDKPLRRIIECEALVFCMSVCESLGVILLQCILQAADIKNVNETMLYCLEVTFSKVILIFLYYTFINRFVKKSDIPYALSCFIISTILFQFMNGKYKRSSQNRYVYIVVETVTVIFTTCINMFNHSILNLVLWGVLTGVIAYALYYEDMDKPLRRIIECEALVFCMSVCESLGVILLQCILQAADIKNVNETMLYCLEVTFSKVILIFLYYTFINRFVKKSDIPYAKTRYIMYGMILLYNLINMGVIVENFKNGEENYLCAVNMGCIVLADLYLLYFVKMADEKNYYEKQLIALEQQAKVQYEYYLTQTKKYDQTVHILHDVNKHIKAIEGLYGAEQGNTAGEYAAEIRELLKPLIPVQYTENPILNILLTDKESVMKEKGISVTIKVDNVNLNFLAPIDITTIFGNLLDNAIEAAEKLEGGKYISIKIGSYHKMIAASIENNCGEVKWKNGFPVSAKGKGGGIGLLNVQSSVKKYDGNLILKSDGNKFIAELFLNS